MYHKVNDLPNNRMSMPVSLFDEQMAQLRELGYRVVDLDAVLAHYVERRAAARGRGADHLRRRLPRQPARTPRPSCRSTATRRVLFVPHRATSATRSRCRTSATSPRTASTTRPSTGTRSASSSAYGVRIESHGISHRPLAELEIDEAAREIAISKLQLEERLGRPVRAFSYVKGSEARLQARAPEPRQAGGLRHRVHVGVGRERAASDPLQLRRYNVEPYSARTFELVLAGACDLISVKDTVTGTHARRVFNAALGTSSR